MTVVSPSATLKMVTQDTASILPIILQTDILLCQTFMQENMLKMMKWKLKSFDSSTMFLLSKLEEWNVLCMLSWTVNVWPPPQVPHWPLSGQSPSQNESQTYDLALWPWHWAGSAKTGYAHIFSKTINIWLKFEESHHNCGLLGDKSDTWKLKFVTFLATFTFRIWHTWIMVSVNHLNEVSGQFWL